MIRTTHERIGIVVECWDSLRRNALHYAHFIDACSINQDKNILVLSLNPSLASALAFSDQHPKSFVVDSTLLSVKRLMRLTDAVYRFEENTLKRMSGSLSVIAASAARFGLVVSNGYGLGHVMRMKSMAELLENHGSIAYISFSAALHNDAQNAVMHLASGEYLGCSQEHNIQYVREAAQRFIALFSPTHMLYDGNVIPDGLLAALAARPDIHLTWIRRGMWKEDVKPDFMARQALVDTIIEPGDHADVYDTGPTLRNLKDYFPPRTFFKTAPFYSTQNTVPFSSATARETLGLLPDTRYALLMLGVHCPHTILKDAVDAVRSMKDLTPVIAHWPMASTPPVQMVGAITVEMMPIASYFSAFEIIISAAGYNSFHEILETDIPAVFVPQEEAERDQQTARAQFADDHALAGFCRQHEVASQLGAKILTQIREYAMVATHRQTLRSGMVNNNAGIIRKALGISLENPAIFSRTTLMESKSFTRILKHAFKHVYKRNAHSHIVFLVAIGKADAARFMKKLKSYPISARQEYIVVTNSISPILLRRLGYKYLWVNDAWLSSEWAIKRQCITWLSVWKPKALKIL